MSFSGLTFAFDPWFKPSLFPGFQEPDPGEWDERARYAYLRDNDGAGEDEGSYFNPSGIRRIRVGKDPIRPEKIYQVAVQHAFAEGIEFVNKTLVYAVDMKASRDTGMEAWRILNNYISHQTPLSLAHPAFETRIRTVRPDLSVMTEQMTLTRSENGRNFDIRLRIKNIGQSPSPAAESETRGPRVQISFNDASFNPAKGDLLRPLGRAQPLALLPSDETQEFEWKNVAVPSVNSAYPVTVEILGAQGMTAHSGPIVTRWFTDWEVGSR